jgi:hypothetical protein
MEEGDAWQKEPLMDIGPGQVLSAKLDRPLQLACDWTVTVSHSFSNNSDCEHTYIVYRTRRPFEPKGDALQKLQVWIGQILV